MDETIWTDLPEVRNIEFSWHGHKDTEETYSEPQKMPPYGIFRSDADFTWEGLRFTSRREWFGAPRNPHLFVFRQIIEPFANCDFSMKSWISLPDDNSVWEFLHYLDQEDNSCGMLLKNKESGCTGLLCETTQITSFSLKVQETRDEVTRKYELMAFEESPIKIEKYLSFHMDDEENYQSAAFRECREASRIRFDDIKGRGTWEMRKK